MRIRPLFFLAALLWAGIVFFLSSRTSAQTPPMPHPVDWCVHCGAFFGLSFLLALAFGRPRTAWIAVLLTSLYGCGDEIHQYFTPGRDCSLGDWLADTLGAASALVAWAFAWVQGRRFRS